MKQMHMQFCLLSENCDTDIFDKLTDVQEENLYKSLALCEH